MFIILYQIQGGSADVNPGSILRINDQRTRDGHRIYLPTATEQVFKYSFYPRTIQDWNRLPAATTDSSTLEESTAAIQHNSSFHKQSPVFFNLYIQNFFLEGDDFPSSSGQPYTQKKTPDLFPEDEDEIHATFSLPKYGKVYLTNSICPREQKCLRTCNKDTSHGEEHKNPNPV